MKSLLQNKERAFWTLQTLGWLGYGFIRLFNGMAHGRELDYAYPTIIAALTGFNITLIMRYVFRSLRTQPLPVVVSVSVLLSGVLAFVFSTIETLGHASFYKQEWEPQGWEFFGNAMLDAYVLLSWTALYFGINYYLMLKSEQEKALQATAAAHQAQLKMLRYQLNPHFLFNTLNAISTLVLDKSIEPANRMLTRLSAFLRYTLVNQPTQKVTLEQELHALSLYLEIEKVRFQDRLKLDYDIEEKSKSALIPSLLMQPLIENAVKYAIAPAEDGGTISIAAKVEDGMLRLTLRDDGPGIGQQEEKIAPSSSGVGIANTKERLTQIYGRHHEFRLTNLRPKGLEIFIAIPFEDAPARSRRAA